jgi:hypothetical protein
LIHKALVMMERMQIRGPEELKPGTPPRRVAAVLNAVGLSDEDVARATQANISTVRRWRHSADQDAPIHNADRIDDLRAIIARLRFRGAVSDAGIVWWLRSRNLWLDDQRPLELIGAGQFERVRAAAEVYLNPEAEVDAEGSTPESVERDALAPAGLEADLAAAEPE